MKRKKKETFKLDSTNFEILKALSESGRVSYSKIGRNLGMTHVSIKNRFENMLEKKIIQPTIGLNYSQLNLKLGLLLLEIEFQSFSDLMRIYQNCPRVIYYFPLMGQYNLAVLFYGENEQTFETILHSCMLYCLNGVRKSNLLIIGNLPYQLFLPFKFHLLDPKSEIAPCGISCKDCNKLEEKLCLGCPTTRYYNGPFKVKSKQI